MYKTNGGGKRMHCSLIELFALLNGKILTEMEFTAFVIDVAICIYGYVYFFRSLDMCERGPWLTW